LPEWDADRVIGASACQDWISSYQLTSESAPGWSPSGREIVAFSTRNPRGELSYGPYLVNINTGGWRQLAHGSPWKNPRTVLWHPRERLALVSYDSGADILDIDNGSLQTLADPDGQSISGARWSPEGDSIWYGRTGGLHAMAITGGTARLAIPLSVEFSPGGGWSFSPDGRTIAFAHFIREDNGVVRWRAEIRLIDRDGRNVRQLTNLAGNAQNPIWIHGGGEILFDWADTLCVNRTVSPDRRWFAVDVQSGRIRSVGDYLGRAEFQFSFPIGVDPEGGRAAVVAEGSLPGDNKRTVGVLYTTLIDLDTRERLFRPGSPELP
jgi:Tol biopolymer transport system component